MRTTRLSRRTLALAGAALLTTVLTACGSGTDHDMPGMNHDGASPSASASAGHAMPGMDHGAPVADGAGAPADNRSGYRFDAAAATLPAGQPTDYRFSITGPDGKPVTAFAVEQTKQMHFYAIRSDLTGFQHLHPTMAPDGTWTAPLAALTSGSWRTYASFTPDTGDGKGTALVLSRTVDVDGRADAAPLPAAATTTQVDGYTVTLQGAPMATMAHPVTVTVTKDGKPVTDLQPYLDTYAHLTAFHEGDMAFAHLHPASAAAGGRGGPELAFHAEFPQAGNWRLFLQFQTAGQLHTAALTLKVG
ncbi:hypothetical protein [Kitasatospora terrestris]|uniref:Heavy metal-binding domain-containing protein n=1 Tax=Kitasatospora terrestris TaxID=258051 RepID=A0ABP9DBX9_9ACTN